MTDYTPMTDFTSTADFTPMADFTPTTDFTPKTDFTSTADLTSTTGKSFFRITQSSGPAILVAPGRAEALAPRYITYLITNVHFILH